MNRDVVIKNIDALEKVKDNQDLIGLLKTIEPVFKDWVNEEDNIYDSL